jgi:methylenetetrahydrofolate dehydrogenase (NADP+)/methenyltetrahydrofolate cyclohydrolase
MTTILDGKVLAQKLKDQLKDEVIQLKSDLGMVPSVVNVIIGNDPGSCAYAKSQQKVAQYIGIKYELCSLPSDISQNDLIEKIKSFNANPKINGIMIHKPIPDHINYDMVANYIDTIKDLEGINIANIGKMILGETKILPCTPASVMEHLKSTGVDLRGKEVVIIGHSNIVGKPLSLLLLKEFATVTICHVATSEAGKLDDHLSRADILIVAVGKAGLIKGDCLKNGVIVVDVGINRVDNKIIGDVDFESVKPKASYITPVPGGVGPVTVVVLMRNSIEALKAQLKIKAKV